MVTFAQRLSYLREKAGLTQANLAERLDITKAAISSWERGQSRPRLDKLDELAAILGTTSTYLLNGTEVQKGSMQAPALVSDVALVPLKTISQNFAGGGQSLLNEPEKFVQLPPNVTAAHPRAFLIQVKDTSMSRRFPVGCLVLIDPDIELESGAAVLYLVDGVYYLRQALKGNQTLVLVADSYEEHSDLVLAGTDIEKAEYVGTAVFFLAATDS